MNTQTAPKRVLVIGSINVDVTIRTQRIPTAGETIHGRGPEIFPGGKGANQAVAAAKLGATVTMAGAVGDDPYADAALQGLTTSGVDLHYLLKVPGPSGMAFITVDDDGNNMIVVTPGANAAMNAMRMDQLRAEVTTSDLIVLQGEIPIDGLSRAIELANHRVVLNLAPVVDLPSYLLSRADPLIVNEHEGRLALGVMTGTDPDASLSDEDVLQRLIEHGVRSVIMTRGEQGALVADRDGLAAVPSPKVKVVDTTGAGDAFVGATVAALAEGSTLIDAARFAARVGAYACTGRGAQPSYPDSASPLPDQRQGAR